MTYTYDEIKQIINNCKSLSELHKTAIILDYLRRESLLNSYFSTGIKTMIFGKIKELM